MELYECPTLASNLVPLKRDVMYLFVHAYSEEEGAMFGAGSRIWNGGWLSLCPGQ